MDPLDLVKLPALMQRTSGDPRLKIALIDGPVATGDPAFAGAQLREVPGTPGACGVAGSAACLHGTFVAGILCAARESAAPAICPGCSLLVRPIFGEAERSPGGMPSATPDELAGAILDCLAAGARVLNVSAALVRPSLQSERALEAALDQAARRGAIVIAAAGNDGSLGSTAITRHPWVIPVVGYDLQGRPMNESNLGRSIGRRGVGAPGSGITSLGGGGEPRTMHGTSAAAPFVTGAVALLWSELPAVAAVDMRLAIVRTPSRARNTVVPPLLDASESYRSLLTAHPQKEAA